MMTHFTDEDLAVLAAKNNELALEALIARYLQPIYAYAYRLVQNSTDAQDITQEVCVKMWKKIGTYDSKKIFRPWIYTITKNTCLDLLKKKSPLPFSALEKDADESWLAQSIIDDAPQPDTLTDRALLHDTLHAHLTSLPTLSHAVISDHHDNGLTFQEIANKTRESTNTVKSRYRRAMGQLRKLLQKD